MSGLINLLICVIAIFPKINIIGISGSTAGIRIEDLFIVLYLMYKIVCSKKIKIESHTLTIVLKMFSLYIGICIISTIIGLWNGWVTLTLALLFMLRKIEYFCMIFIGYDYYKKLKDDKEIEKMLNVCIMIHFILVLLQLFGIIGSFNHGEALSTLTQGRISSTFNGAYEFSGFLLLFFPNYIMKMIKNKEHKIKNAMYILIIIFCIYISKSRTSLIIAVIQFLLIYMKTSQISVRKLALNSFTLIIVVIAVALALWQNKINLSRFENFNISGVEKVFKLTWENKNYEKYVKYRYWYGNANYTLDEIEKSGLDASLYVRVSHWMQLIDGWSKSPIFGLGVSISGSAADGNYVRILTESGILGILSWMKLMIYLYKKLKNNEFIIQGVEFSILSLLLGAIFIDVFEASKIMMIFWFLIGMICCEEVKNEKSS